MCKKYDDFLDNIGLALPQAKVPTRAAAPMICGRSDPTQPPRWGGITHLLRGGWEGLSVAGRSLYQA